VAQPYNPGRKTASLSSVTMVPVLAGKCDEPAGTVKISLSALSQMELNTCCPQPLQRFWRLMTRLRSGCTLGVKQLQNPVRKKQQSGLSRYSYQPSIVALGIDTARRVDFPTPPQCVSRTDASIYARVDLGRPLPPLVLFPVKVHSVK